MARRHTGLTGEDQGSQSDPPLGNHIWRSTGNSENRPDRSLLRGHVLHWRIFGEWAASGGGGCVLTIFKFVFFVLQN